MGDNMTDFYSRIKILLRIVTPCSHEFKGREMQHRNSDGIVKWPCCKCGKQFEAKSGLEILQNGKCIGGWS